jgi:carboxyl-terminal processing protease
LIRLRSRFIQILLLLVCILLPMTNAWAVDTDKGELLNEVREIIKNEFVRPVDESILNKSTVQELIAGLNDPYSAYLTPEEYKAFVESTDQIFSGVGMQVELVGEYVTVVSPLKNTPAQKAGIKSGDKVVAIDGENVVGKPLDYAVAKIRGEAGTAVVLTILREGEAEPLVIMITRERISVEVVEAKILQKGIGYIHLTTFSQKAGREFASALAVLRAQGMEALVFDLRQNPGGYLSAGLDVAADFAGKGDLLLHVVGRDGIKDSYQSLSDALGIPTAVLVDGGSASASEIVAGAIQDLGAGKLVGTQTFGKASVQTVFNLANKGALKLTTAKYLTPSERVIHGVGLTPDYVVEGEEAQLKKAIELLEVELGSKPVTRAPLQVMLTLNKKTAQVGEKEVALDAKPLVIKGRTFVPLRFIGEAFGGQVNWNKASKTATIQYRDKEIFLTPKSNTPISRYRNKLLKDNVVADGPRYNCQNSKQGNNYSLFKSCCQIHSVYHIYEKQGSGKKEGKRLG